MEKYKVWFIADTHFYHKNGLYYKPKRREHAGITLEELQQADSDQVMCKYDEWLISRWNETVGKHDTVYILGDFCLGNRDKTRQILSRLHGKKYLIRGNHDKSCKGLENYFEWVGDIKEAKFSHEQFPFIDINETFCVEMCHYPLMAWNRRTHGACHAHGHVHSALDKLNEESEELRVDVGIDGALADYNLIDLETLYSHFRAIIERAGCKTFQEYAEWLMAKQGYRI